MAIDRRCEEECQCAAGPVVRWLADDPMSIFATAANVFSHEDRRAYEDHHRALQDQGCRADSDDD